MDSEPKVRFYAEKTRKVSLCGSVIKVLFSLLIIIVTIILDQLTKYLAVIFLKNIETFPIIKGALHFTYVENKGAAFGILSDSRWVFIVISTVAIIGLGIYLFRFAEKNYLLRTGLAFIVGGGIGNMIDRTLLGYVVDFVDFRLINFAVFNIADTFVCIGAALLLIYVFFFAEKEQKNGTEKDRGNTR